MENIEIVTKEQRLQAQREYMRQWRAKNKDKLKEYQAKYWSKKATEGQDN